LSTPPKNIVASILARLRNQAQAQAVPFNQVLQFYAMERFLYRLSKSPHVDGVLLKGALLLRAYPLEAVVAEKFHAMVELDLANSRVKDFYDIWVYSRHTDFDGPTLAKSFAATFTRRNTALPIELPTALTPLYFESEDHIKQWQAFVRRIGEPNLAASFPDLVGDLAAFLMPQRLRRLIRSSSNGSGTLPPAGLRQHYSFDILSACAWRGATQGARGGRLRSAFGTNYCLSVDSRHSSGASGLGRAQWSYVT
jgi:hypothetical protein